MQWSLERGIPRRSFLSRRAIDGTRGRYSADDDIFRAFDDAIRLIKLFCRKYFDPNEEGSFDSYGSAGGQYDPYDHVTGECRRYLSFSVCAEFCILRQRIGGIINIPTCGFFDISPLLTLNVV